MLCRVEYMSLAGIRIGIGRKTNGVIVRVIIPKNVGRFTRKA